MAAHLAGVAVLAAGAVCLCFLLREAGPPETNLQLGTSSNTHNGLFQDVQWNARSIVCIITTFTVSAFANAAGVGGLKEAMALTQAAITGGAIAAGAMALFDSHPLDDTQPLLDLDVALVILPCLLLGVTIGVTMNQVFPDWLLVIILTFLLMLLSFKTLRSGLRLRAAELRSTEENEDESLLIAASSEVPAVSPKAGRNSFERSLEAARSAGSDRLSVLIPSQPFDSLAVRLGNNRIEENEGDAAEAIESHPVQLDGSYPSSLASSPRSEQYSPQTSLDTLLQASGGKKSSLNQHDGTVEAGEQLPIRAVEGWGAGRGEASFDFQTPFQRASEAHATSRKQTKCYSHLQQSLQLLVVILIWAAFLGLQLFKDRFFNCSRPYFAIFGSQIALCIALSALFLTIWRCSGRRHSRSEEMALLPSPRPARPYAPTFKLLLSGLAVLVGGALAALCGLGGGMVLGPVMLELGLHPLVTASTSLLLVGASSSSATIEFSLADRLPHGWALIVFLLCVVASLVGVAVIGRYVRASGRASVIVFLLTIVTFAGGILTAVYGGIRAVHSLQHGGRAGFIDLCEI